MPSPLQKQTTQTFAWAQNVGQGSEGFGATLAWGPGSDIQTQEWVNWSDFARGTVIQEWLGYAQTFLTVSGGSLQRFLPKRCPIPKFDFMWCKGISGIPKVWLSKNPGETIDGAPGGKGGGPLVNVGPYSDFQRALCTLHYGPPPFAVLSDAELAAQYPFTVNVSGIVGVADQTQITVQDTSVFTIGMTVTGIGIPNGTTIVGITPPNTLILSNAATVMGGGGVTFAAQNAAVGMEQFRFCYWHVDPQLRVGQRNIGAFNYILGAPAPGPTIFQTFQGFQVVLEPYKDITCDWWYVPDNYYKSQAALTLNSPLNLDACVGRVNATTFSTPKGTFAPGTLLFKTYKDEPQEAPLALTGIQRSGPMVLQKISMKFSAFSPPTNPNAVIPPSSTPAIYGGHNTAWFLDGFYYPIATTGGRSASPYLIADLNKIFQKSP
jgi:hypothetical protein